MLDKFAEELHEAREKSGVSLQQMALKTRIDIKYLEAIDKGDFAFLPEPYVKAFLKDFARLVGLDETRIIQKYEAAKKGKSLGEKTDHTPDENEGEKPVTPRKVHTYDATPPKPDGGSGTGFNRRILINGLIVIGIIIIIVVLFLNLINGSDDIVIAEKPIEEIIEDNRQRFEEPQQNAADQVQLSDSLNLTVLASDTSWVQIIYDDKNRDEFTLFPNSQKTIRAGNNFKITLGNSGAVKFRLNNQSVEFSGKAGSVSYVQINKDGLTRLLNPPVLKPDE